jgi:hypothetical protein
MPNEITLDAPTFERYHVVATSPKTYNPCTRGVQVRLQTIMLQLPVGKATMKYDGQMR